MTATAETTSRPILFSAPMIRAILSGTKTMTRRVVKPQPGAWATPPVEVDHEGYWCSNGMRSDLRCPYGKVSDLLLVRESWRTWERPADLVDGVLYRADGAFRPIENTR